MKNKINQQQQNTDNGGKLFRKGKKYIMGFNLVFHGENMQGCNLNS